MAEEYQAYMKSHPEIKYILSDFLTDVLTNKPDNLFDYGKDYFECISGAYQANTDNKS